MEFRILGPLDVRADNSEQVAVSRPRQRAALCVLLLWANHPLTAETLSNALWGDDPPGDPRGALKSCAYSLRKVLGPDNRLRTHSVGYVFQLRRDDLLDLRLFRDLTLRGRRALSLNDHAAAAHLLRQALDQWSEPYLVDFPTTVAVNAEAAALLEQRNIAQEALVEARLALGQHDDLIPELRALAAADPMRERRWAQLMTGLYRSGRQAEALHAYRQARTVLIEECGIDPGPALQQLQQQILARDPALNLPAIRAAGPRARGHLNVVPPPVTTGWSWPAGALADGWHDDPGTAPLLRDRATTDTAEPVRQTAIQALADGWHDDPATAPLLRDRATTDTAEPVRQTAIQALADGWHDDPATAPLLRDRATTDTAETVRQTAIQALADSWHDDPATAPLLRDRATTDTAEAVRQTAIQALADSWHDDPATAPLLRDHATTDTAEAVRQTAIQALADGWHDDPATAPLLRDHATTDTAEAVRQTAIQALAAG